MGSADQPPKEDLTLVALDPSRPSHRPQSKQPQDSPRGTIRLPWQWVHCSGFWGRRNFLYFFSRLFTELSLLRFG